MTEDVFDVFASELKRGEDKVDRNRISEYYRTYADTVTRAAWHYTGDVHSAQDCTEEAFLRLMKQEDMPEAKILPWLIRTAVNAVKDILRSSGHKLTKPYEENAVITDNIDRSLEERAAVRAVFSLDELYRLPLYLHLVEGYSIRKTAKLIDKGFNTTASLIRRGKKLLREAYEKERTI